MLRSKNSLGNNLLNAFRKWSSSRFLDAFIPTDLHRASQCGKRIRRASSENVRQVSDLRASRRGGFLRLGPAEGTQKFRQSLLPTTQRQQIADGNAFLPWLESRIGLLLRQPKKDPRFSVYLQNLLSLIQDDSIRSELEGGKNLRLNTEQAQAWRPKEKSRPLGLLRSLKVAFLMRGPKAVDEQIEYTFNGILATRENIRMEYDDQEKLLDLRYPAEWYPVARQAQRDIHLHIGPTNSGKTYHALKALEASRSGIYAGPLRLLAHEVYSRLNSMGKSCDLSTGDEQIQNQNEDTTMTACTVEMAPLGAEFDVGVIDEIQMIGDGSRGWAWTQALLGLKARELHLCGEARTLPLIREIVASIGDKLHVHTYERLTPLQTMTSSLHGSLRNLRKGDCVVCFSRIGIHAIKSQIELATQRRVAIVYGSLPPEIRAQQASLFNDPDNDYDFLVASDAIGMGLNLAIKRVVFETIYKSNGLSIALIPPNQVKQIAGRAGRYRTARQDMKNQADSSGQGTPGSSSTPNIGLVTTLEEQDLPYIRKIMESEPPPIMTAGIQAPRKLVVNFAQYYPPSINFSYVLLRLQELALLGPRFHLCTYKDQTYVADVIQPVTGLSINDRLLFCSAPAGAKDDAMTDIILAFARCLGEHTSGELLKIPELPLEVLDEQVRVDKKYVERLEMLHKALILYLWLGYRFPGCYVDRDMAFHVKRLVEEKIDYVLVEFSASPIITGRILRARAQARQAVEADSRISDTGDSPSPVAENKPEVPLDDLSPGDAMNDFLNQINEPELRTGIASS